MTKIHLSGSCNLSSDSDGITLSYVEHSTYELHDDVDTTIDISNVHAKAVLELLLKQLLPDLEENVRTLLDCGVTYARVDDIYAFLKRDE